MTQTDILMSADLVLGRCSNVDRVKRKSAFEHAQIVRIHIIGPAHAQSLYWVFVLI